MNTQRAILDAAIERSVIRGTLTAATGDRCDFHGWLELTTAHASHPAEPFESEPLHVSEGERVKISGIDWSALASSEIRVAAGSKPQSVRDHQHQSQVAGVASLGMGGAR